MWNNKKDQVKERLVNKAGGLDANTLSKFNRLNQEAGIIGEDRSYADSYAYQNK